MKEIGKLIELLNEYERNVVMKSYMHPVYYYDEDKNKILNLYIGFNTEDEVKYQWLLSYIVSARYGFIGWLIENKKLKSYRAYKDFISQNYVEFENGAVIPSVNGQLYDSVLCGLAIQDEPISFLCEILK